MKTNEVKVPRNAPAALVVRGKVTVFNPENPHHLRWFIKVAEQMIQQSDFSPYPPLFDTVVSQADLAEWAAQQHQYDKAMATRAWTMLWRALQHTSTHPWNPSVLHEQERRAGVIPLGLLVGRAPFLGGLRGSSASLNQWQVLVRAYLTSCGLRVGMDTRAWLCLREQTLRG
ncbi:MAG: hypothetical protein ACK5YK_02420 [Pseudomonadota bacterium]|jgi:hypothetical protein